MDALRVSAKRGTQRHRHPDQHLVDVFPSRPVLADRAGRGSHGYLPVRAHASPPANVDFSIVNNTDGPLKTVRERLLAHATTPTCASCHNHSDPIGLTLEHFDSTGAHRLQENGQLIDVSGTIKARPSPARKGLGRYLHDNPKFPACLARKLYSYGVGADSEDVNPRHLQSRLQGFCRWRLSAEDLVASHGHQPRLFRHRSPSAADTRTAMNK